MINKLKKLPLSILVIIVSVLSLALVQQQVFAGWEAPEGAPPTGETHLFVNPMIEDLDLNSNTIIDTSQASFVLNPGGSTALNISGSTWAGYFGGNVHITGDLTVDGSYPGGSTFWQAGAGTEIYYDQAGGNVGIGTNNPNYLLHVNGLIRAEDGLRSGGGLEFNLPGNGDAIVLRGEGTTSNHTLRFNDKPLRFWTSVEGSVMHLSTSTDGAFTGFVGINREPGFYPLDVNGAIYTNTQLLSNALYGTTGEFGGGQDIWLGNANDDIQVQGEICFGADDTDCANTWPTGGISDTYQEEIIEVSSAGWKRVAHIDGSVGRGQNTVTIYNRGGTYAAYSSKIRWFKSWDDNGGITILSEYGNTNWTQARITRVGENSYLEIYFLNAMGSGPDDGNLRITLQYEGGYARGQLYSGVLPAGNGTVVATADMALLNVGSDKFIVGTDGVDITNNNNSILRLHDSTSGVGLDFTGNWPAIGFNRYYNAGNFAMGDGYTGVISMNPAAGDIQFYTGTYGNAGDAVSVSEKMTIANNGDVGIGIANPSYDLQVDRGADTASFGLTGGTDRHLHLSIGASNAIYSTNNEHEFQTDGNIKAIIGDTRSYFNGEIFTDAHLLSDALYGTTGNGGVAQDIWLGDTDDDIQVQGEICFGADDSDCSDTWSGSGPDNYIGNAGTHTAGGQLKMGNFNLNLDGEWLSGDGNDEGIFITSSGRVGINTNAPSESLQVINSSGARVLFSNISGADRKGLLFESPGTTHPSYSRIDSYDYGLSSPLDLVLVAAGGDVGIDVTNPAAKLDVLGDIRASGGDLFANALYGRLGGAEDIWLGDADDDIQVQGEICFGSDNSDCSDTWSGSGPDEYIGNVGPHDAGGQLNMLANNITLGNNQTVDGVDISDYSSFWVNSAGTNNYVWTSDGSGRGDWQPAGSGADGYIGGNTPDPHVVGADINLNGHWIAGDGDNEGLYVNTSGQVGIGSSNPLGTLDVSNRFIVNTAMGTPDRWKLAVGDGSGWKGHIAQDDGDILVTFRDDGNVGIGDTTPDYPLDVAGNNINVEGTSGDVSYRVDGRRTMGRYPGWDNNELYINSHSDWTSGVTVAGTGGLHIDNDLTVDDDFDFYGEISPDGDICGNTQILQKTGSNNWDCVNYNPGGSDGYIGDVGTHNSGGQLNMLANNITLGNNQTVDGVDLSDYSNYFIDSDGTNNYVWTSDGSGRGGWQASGSGSDGYIGLAGPHNAGGQLNMGSSNINLQGEWLSGDGTDEGVFVATSGNVGVGDSTPSYDLDVSGVIRASSDLRAVGDLYVGDDIDFDGEIFPGGATCTNDQILQKFGANDWRCADMSGGSGLWSAGSGNNIFYNESNGNVGIGISVPATKLDVREAGNFTPNTDYLAYIGSYAGAGTGSGLLVQSGWYNQAAPVIAQFSALASGYVEVPRLTIKSSGNVGIGTEDPDYLLDITGVLNLNKGETGGDVALRVTGQEALWYSTDTNIFSYGYGGQGNYFADPVIFGSGGGGGVDDPKIYSDENSLIIDIGS